MLDKIGLTAPNQTKDENDEQYNYFKDNGYEVDYLLGNLGSTLVFIILLPAAYLILGIMRLLGKRY